MLPIQKNHQRTIHHPSSQICNSPSFCNHGAASGKFVVWVGGLCWIASWKRLLPIGSTHHSRDPQHREPLGHPDPNHKLNCSCGPKTQPTQPYHTCSPCKSNRLHPYVGRPWSLARWALGLHWETSSQMLKKCMDYYIHHTFTKGINIWRFIWVSKKSFRWQIIEKERCKIHPNRSANLRSRQIIQIEE